MAASAHLLPSANQHESKPGECTEPDPLAALSYPDSGLEGSASAGGAEPPLTSEPPLADASPLTSEPPLAAELPLTSEPTAAVAGGAEGTEPMEI